mgnify:CR=1 FL=1|tara:strand:- start:621 stop:1190 length:570 start_codon:yes stop_codon:yes gene_type:complete
MDRKLIISICVLIGLFCFYLYDSSKQKSYQENYANIFEFNHDKIHKVIILKDGDGIELEKLDSTWQINGHDSLVIKLSAIDKLFNETLNVEINMLPVSNNPKDLSIYSLDSKLGINLILLDIDGKTLSNSMFGIASSNYHSSFYKDFDNSVIYKTNSNVITFLTPNLKYWGETPSQNIPDSTISVPSDL